MHSLKATEYIHNKSYKGRIHFNNNNINKSNDINNNKSIIFDRNNDYYNSNYTAANNRSGNDNTIPITTLLYKEFRKNERRLKIEMNNPIDARIINRAETKATQKATYTTKFSVNYISIISYQYQ